MRRRFIAVLLGSVLLSAITSASSADPLAQRASGWGLPTLMASLQQVRAASASFIERKYMKMLSAPLQSSGKLVYVRPDKLQKDTVAPRPQRLIVEGDRLIIEQEGERRRSLSLQDYPQIWAFVESIRATLAGDLNALSRFYNVSLKGGPERWTLELIPKDAKTRELVTAIRISGEGSTIRGVVTQESDGDRTDLTILAETR